MESTTQIFLLVQVGEKDFVEGQAYAAGYSKRIQVDSFAFKMDAKNQELRASSEERGNNLDFDQATVTKFFDTASPRLGKLLGKRDLLEEVRITVDQQLEEKGQDRQNAIIVFHLYESRLVDQKFDVTEDKVSAVIKETLAFTFRNFEVEYYFKGDDRSDASKRSDYRNEYVNFRSEYTTETG